MNPPKAVIAHRAPARLRLRIPERKGNEAYFVHVHEVLSRLGPLEIDFNPRTGSVLLMGKDMELERIGGMAAELGLFTLETLASELRPELRREIVKLLRRLDSLLTKATRGEVDASLLAFVSFIGLGVVYVLREGLTIPPWYVAFSSALMLAPYGLGSAAMIEARQAAQGRGPKRA